MTTRAQATSPAGKRGIALGLLLTLVPLGGYFFSDRQDVGTTPGPPVEAVTQAPQRGAAATAAPPAQASIALASPTATTHRMAERHESAHLHGANQTPPPSHPIDAQRRRIYRENNLHAALMSAMNQSDVPSLRALVEEYRSAYPEDEYGLQDGYTLVANCLDQLTLERQEQARHYWRTNRSSTVRRFIRRYCLERPVVTG